MHMHTGAFAATDMNDHSSRSHVIFTITVERSDLGPDHQQHVRMGKLHLVDLAVRVGEKGEGREEGGGGGGVEGGGGRTQPVYVGKAWQC